MGSEFMKYSVPKQVDYNAEVDGIVFFAQRLEEMLSNASIDLYKMPLLNTHGLAAEYCDVVKRVSDGTIKEYQRDIVYEEFIASFKNDIVLKENWGNDNINQVLNSFGTSNQKDKNNIVAYIDATLGNGKYLNWSKNTILKYTCLPKEKKNIEAVLRCFLPELIMLGYEPNFISTTVQAHFFKGKNGEICSARILGARN